MVFEELWWLVLGSFDQFSSVWFPSFAVRRRNQGEMCVLRNLRLFAAQIMRFFYNEISWNFRMDPVGRPFFAKKTENSPYRPCSLFFFSQITFTAVPQPRSPDNATLTEMIICGGSKKMWTQFVTFFVSDHFSDFVALSGGRGSRGVKKSEHGRYTRMLKALQNLQENEKIP